MQPCPWARHHVVRWSARWASRPCTSRRPPTGSEASARLTRMCAPRSKPRRSRSIRIGGHCALLVVETERVDRALEERVPVEATFAPYLQALEVEQWAHG